MNNLFLKYQNLAELRRLIINNVEFKGPFIYKKAFYAVINPTDFCPVGCVHCLYSSVKMKTSKVNRSQMKSFIKIANQANLKMLVFSGGGEPFENLEEMLYAIENIKSLEDVIIITSAYFAKSPKITKNILDRIYNVANKNRKKKGLKKVIITLRISRDNAQCNIIPSQNIINIIDYFIKKADFSNFRILIRTVLDYKENQDLEISKKLGFFLLPLKDKNDLYKDLPIIDAFPTRWIVNENKKISIPVIYKPLYFVGRGLFNNHHNIHSLWKIIESEEKSGTLFNLCLRGAKGEGHNYYETVLKGYDFWREKINSKLIYNTPKNKNKKNLALYVQASGNVLINNGVPDIAINLKNIKSWNNFLRIISEDLVQRLLVENGPFFVKDIAEEVEKDLIKRIEKTNFVFAVSLLSLETPALRLYATIRAAQHYLKLGKIKIKNKELEEFIIGKKDRELIGLYKKWKDLPENKKAQATKAKDPITADIRSIYG